MIRATGESNTSDDQGHEHAVVGVESTNGAVHSGHSACSAVTSLPIDTATMMTVPNTNTLTARRDECIERIRDTRRPARRRAPSATTAKRTLFRVRMLRTGPRVERSGACDSNVAEIARLQAPHAAAALRRFLIRPSIKPGEVDTRQETAVPNKGGASPSPAAAPRRTWSPCFTHHVTNDDWTL